MSYLDKEMLSALDEIQLSLVGVGENVNIIETMGCETCQGGCEGGCESCTGGCQGGCTGCSSCYGGCTGSNN